MNDKEILTISQKYNHKYAREFGKKDAETKFISPIVATVTSIDEREDLFTREQEQSYFKALHYVKYRLALESQKKTSQVQKYASYYERIRNRITCANIKLLRKCISLTSIRLDEEVLIDVGNLALIDAVDNFDPWRGFNFSTYATHCILRRFAREAKKLSLVPINEDIDPSDVLPNIAANQKDDTLEFLKEKLRFFIRKRINGLTKQDIEILMYRFRLDDPYGKKFTLQKMSDKYGMSKERIRQLQNAALEKLKKAFDDNNVLS